MGKWADMKYQSWDKRNHYGIGGWGACSTAFEDTMAWAPPIDEAGCDAAALKDCGKDLLEDCQSSAFSSTAGSNSVYEKSWAGCREVCTTPQWQQWCNDQNCAGSDHSKQCQNVTDAVHRPYTVQHMPAGNAWEEGELCRDVSFLCTGVDTDVKTAGDLGLAGLVFAMIGLGCLVTYSMKQHLQPVLLVSLATWVLAWILLFASWAVFAGAVGKDAECKVEAESKKGVVIAVGKFGDIINESGSYTYGVVIGSWLLSVVPIVLISLRVKDRTMSKSMDAPQEQSWSPANEVAPDSS